MRRAIVEQQIVMMRHHLKPFDIAAAAAAGDIEAAMRKACCLAHNSNRRSSYHMMPITVLRLLNATNWACFYCGDELGIGPTLDHIVPLSLGGENHPKNVVPCCDGCNQLKSACLEDLGQFLQSVGVEPEIFQFRHEMLLQLIR